MKQGNHSQQHSETAQERVKEAFKLNECVYSYVIGLGSIFIACTWLSVLFYAID